MSTLLYKIKCPKHEEDTPSCAVYADGSGYCFGCSTHFQKLAEPQKVAIIPEDLNEKITYIEGLNKITHRGLTFPADGSGYYIVWPQKSYYKLRRWEATEGETSKYTGARGHKKPYFSYPGIPAAGGKTTKNRSCAVIEGEINAMSLNLAYPDLPIHSPGGVGNFTDSTTIKMLPILHQYDQIHIVVDEDIPGVTAAIKLKGMLHPHCKDVVIHLMEEDVNSILVTKGVEGIKEKLKLEEKV